jgi:hypothetical protein
LELREAGKAARAGKEPVDESREVEIEEPDDDEEQIDAEGRETRADRRRRRGEEHEHLVSARAEAMALRAEKAALEARVAAAESRRQPEPAGPDPIDAELATVFEEQDTLISAWNAGADKFTEAQRAEYKKKAQALEIRKGVALARKAGARAPEPPKDPRQIYAEQINDQTKLRYPDVYADPRAIGHANGLRLIALGEGRPDSVEMWAECAEQARSKYKTAPGSRREVAESDRRSHTAAPRGMGTGGQERQTRRVEMTPENRRMAIKYGERFKDPKTGRALTEAQAIQRWVNRVGPRLQKDA